MRRTLLRFFAAVCLLPAACSVLGIDGLGDERDALREARSRWRHERPAEYSYTLARSCFCGTELLGPVRIRVRGDSVLSRTYTADGTPVAAQWARWFGPIDSLFEVIEEAIERDADELRVSYHRELGYTADAYIDYARNAVDDELGFTVSDFTAH